MSTVDRNFAKRLHLSEMEGRKPKPITQIAFALALGAAGGFSLWYWGSPNPKLVAEKRAEEAEERRATKTEPVSARDITSPLGGVRTADPFSGEDSVWATRGQDYARAYRQGRCDEIVTSTQWMQDRLRYVRTRDGGAPAENAAREALCNELQTRTPEANQLTAEGVEDQYLFRPGASIEAVAVDEGRDDLEAPAEARVWLRTEFPAKTKALNDQTGQPIRALTVGLNFSTDGLVLKAGVRGVAEIDWDSISTKWPEEAE